MRLFVLFMVFLLVGSLQSVHSSAQEKKLKEAIFAGGCFWCMEHPFEKLPGVKKVISGYAGGHVDNPSYEDVTHGGTGHVEAVKIVYDPQRISFRKLLDVFWRQIDPTDPGGQFVDRGGQYRSVIFYSDESEKKIAQASKTELANSKRFSKPLVTEITAFSSFYPAEEYHQDYYKKKPLRYKFYRFNSGRDRFLDKYWDKGRGPQKMDGKSSAEDLKKRLTPLQYKVTQKEGTEPAFRNEYWDNKQAGIYVDIVSGEPLFSSQDKYKSGTGWPSFTRPLENKNIVEKVDRKLFVERTEVRSKNADSHLGHVFNDGPQPTGLRYCINSAALRFIPVNQLEQEGYGQYKILFEK